jgi:hypothetical protein
MDQYRPPEKQKSFRKEPFPIGTKRDRSKQCVLRRAIPKPCVELRSVKQVNIVVQHDPCVPLSEHLSLVEALAKLAFPTLGVVKELLFEVLVTLALGEQLVPRE